MYTGYSSVGTQYLGFTALTNPEGGRELPYKKDGGVRRSF